MKKVKQNLRLVLFVVSYTSVSGIQKTAVTQAQSCVKVVMTSITPFAVNVIH